ncbi:hypothetical protein PPYR_07226 [Photinus pyralis]|uniref:Uncharacterized protein n=1 Tax=Photinus pyralis TaxID=7054 RepID=A0A1Y1LK24_PHOPY|nr:uncharacterized protein LOC116167576 [Photinus pyralis]KAB0799346.1 hypothetical protein PPYR_07226 [Photinus pyralis]
MNLSQDAQDILNSMRVIKENLDACSNRSPRLPLDKLNSSMAAELIDVSNINFEDDETWLYASPVRDSNVKDLKTWLYQDTTHLKDYNFYNNHLNLTRELAELDTKKMIDSRTFTRPKKRFVRPSIETYNDGYFGMAKLETDSVVEKSESNRTLQLDDAQDVTVCGEVSSEQTPLKFDLSQPINTNIFDKIVLTSSDVDSFQNMSPPSLINSMCSSTFTNLMENSMIKNDPLLREISVEDYTEAMLQDYDPPVFRSITDSCSSINLDNPDSFIKQHSGGTLNGIYKKSVVGSREFSLNETFAAGDKSDNSTLGDTYVKESSSDISSIDVCNNASVIHNLNGTYRKSPHSKANETYEKLPLCRSNDNLNSTVTYTNDSNRFTSPRRRSYIIEKHSDLVSSQGIEKKRNSFGHSVGSSDSLDYLSSLSSSSRDSNKMLNMAEVDAIVLQQEQSLHAMSTPKPTSKIISKLWEHEHSMMSPVPRDRLNTSDSEHSSSNDEYKTVKSNISASDSSSSVDAPHRRFELKTEPLKIEPKSLNGLKSMNKIPDTKGSYSNLKTVGTTLKGSCGNLKPLGVSAKGASYASNKGSTTNLKTMSANLKGSYTQLKPVLLNLPCTDANNMYQSDSRGMKRPNIPNNLDVNTKTAEVAPTLRDQVKPAAFSSSNAKPQIKASGLPRPISSIPRPSVSKIPGPKSRPLTSRPLSRPISRNNLDYDF